MIIPGLEQWTKKKIKNQFISGFIEGILDATILMLSAIIIVLLWRWLT